MKGLLCLMILWFPGLSMYGQSQQDTLPKSYPSILELTHPELLNQWNTSAETGLKNSPKLKVFSPSLAHTAFFCKIEDKLGKKAKLPVKMRLGDVEYVDKIEGKGIHTHLPKQ